MKVIMRGDKPIVEGLPEGNAILFFAKIDSLRGYCVIYGPKDTCLPKNGETAAELFDAKVGFGQENEEMKICQVKHGHKYSEGGGFVETEEFGQIGFRLKTDEEDQSNYNGYAVEEVFIVT